MTIRWVRSLLCLFAVAAGGLAAAVLTGATAGPVVLAGPSVQILAASASIGVRVDPVSAALLILVAGIGAVVGSVSVRLLDGQRRLARYAWLLLGCVLALAVSVSAASLVVAAAGWSAATLAMAGLIDHPNTPGARRAARLVRRRLLAADGVLWAGLLAIGSQLGTFDRAELASATRSAAADGRLGWIVSAGVLAVVLAAAARSALVPFHRWLPQTAEAPTPVSALLHAGFVNGAGLMAVLLWPVIAAVPVAAGALIGLGALSVAVGTLAARGRNDVKGRLACSTTAQMGYLAVQAGLGLPAAAIAHLVGHGFYKSTLFLAAGSAVVRSGSAAGRDHGVPRAGGRSAVALLALSGLSVGSAVALGANLLDHPAGVLPLLLAAAAVAGAQHAIGASRGSGLVRGLTRGLGVVLLVGYVVVLHRWEALVDAGSGELDGFSVRPWSPGHELALVIGLLGVGLVVLWVDRRAAAGGVAVVAVWAALAAAVPTRVRWWRSPIVVPADLVAARPAVTAQERARARAEVMRAGEVVGPAWPLGTLVAANPIAGLQRLPLHQALPRAARAWGAARGTVSRNVAERVDDALSTQVARIADEQADLWSARLLAAGPGAWPVPELSLYRAWRRQIVVRGGGRGLSVGGRRVTGFAAAVRRLPDRPDEAVSALLELAGVPSSQRVEVLSRTLARRPGWAAHVAWRQRGPVASGVPDTVPGTELADLVAVRLAYQVLLSRAVAGDRWAEFVDWPEPAAPLDLPVWPTTAEHAYRDDLLSRLGTAPPALPGPLRAQLIMCIDVRSERLRRHLEAEAGVQTLGFAGFFGVPARHVDPAGRVSDRCPVLIRPRNTIVETPLTAGPRRQVSPALAAAAGGSSSGPWGGFGAFAVAEAGGLLFGLTSLARTFWPRGWAWLRAAANRRWGAEPFGALEVAAGFSLSERVFLAEAALRTMGLITDVAPLIVVVGHGASTANNPFAAAYDCGACGGTSGDVSARALAAILSDDQVRDGLRERGIDLPGSTRVIAARHDTTLDQVQLLASNPPSQNPDQNQADDDLTWLTAVLARAGQAAAAERLEDLEPADRRPSAGAVARRLQRRAADWAQVRPEWGLAGCAAFVAGPRDLTRGLDLQGRVFLHSYRHDQDRDGGALEVILTAPFVVAQWITAQYAFSTLDPLRFGAGDKATHNVVGGFGVLTGAGGDLRIGLPWQALFRRDPSGPSDSGDPSGPSDRTDPVVGVHEPVRLLGVVQAYPEVVARIIERQRLLQQLIGGGWVNLAVRDPRSAGTVMAVVSDDGLVRWQDWTPAPAGQTLGEVVLT